MTKSIKSQIVCMSLLFALVLLLGCLGIYALNKSQEIKVSYTVSPSILCQIDIKQDGEANFNNKIFSNFNENYISSAVSLDEKRFLLTFTNRLTANFDLQITNYTDELLHIEAKGGNVSCNSIVIPKYTAGNAQSEILNVQVNALMETIPYEMELNFLCVEEEYIEANFLGCKFDLDSSQSNIVQANNKYYVPCGEDFVGKVSSIENATIVIDSVKINTTSIAYSFTNGIVTISKSLITNNINISGHGQFYATTYFTDIVVQSNMTMIMDTDYRMQMESAISCHYPNIISIILNGQDILSKVNISYPYDSMCIITIPKYLITGNITVTAIASPTRHSVTNTLTNCTSNGSEIAIYRTDYTATLQAYPGHSLPTTITVSIGETSNTITSGASAVNGITYVQSTGVITISGFSIYTNVTIIASAPVATYNVITTGLVNCSLSGNPTATHETNYTATLQVYQGHSLPTSITIKIGGTPLALNYTYSMITGAISITGSFITGDVTIEASAPVAQYDVITTGLQNCTSNGVNKATHETDYTATLTPTNSILPNTITVSIGGTNNTITSGASAVNGITYVQSTGVITIDGDYITGTISITAEATLAYNITVNVTGGVQHNYTIVRGTSKQVTITAPDNTTVPSKISVASGTLSSSTYTPTNTGGIWKSANLNITPTSNCTININPNPWTYGQYSGSQFDFTDGSGNARYQSTIWNGYYYVVFANAPNDRWIIIGESQYVFNTGGTGLLPSTSPALSQTTSIDLKYNTNTYNPGIEPRVRMFQELGNNEVLLLKETVLGRQVFNTNADDGNQWSTVSKSALKNQLNGTYFTQNFNDYDEYIVNKDLYTVHSENGVGSGINGAPFRKLTKSNEKIFILSTLGGFLELTSARFVSSSGASDAGLGEIANGTTLPNSWERSNSTYTNYDEIYILQNFNIEMYLGGYTSRSATSNPKLFSFGGAENLFFWLRSGSSDDHNYAGGLAYNGYIGAGGVADSSTGVRPAFVLDLAIGT